MGRLKHGCASHGRVTTEYRIWSHMTQRCASPACPAFKNYGGRGIRVCDRWLSSFENFLADMGKRPGSEYSLDRVNNDGNYEPGNCRWATRAQQRRNSRGIHWVIVDGAKMPLKDACAVRGANYFSVRSRLRLGWTIEESLSIPKCGSPKGRATRKDSARNRAGTHRVVVDGVEMCLTEACELYGKRRQLVKDRLMLGWTLMDALTLGHRASPGERAASHTKPTTRTGRVRKSAR